MSRIPMFLVAAPIFLGGIGIGPTRPVRAQSTSPDSQPDAGGGASLTVAPAGTGRYVAGRWAIVAVNGLNRTDTDAEEMAAVMIGDDRQMQYARRLWIPARSTRQSWLPVKISGDLIPSDLQVKMSSIHVKRTAAGEAFQSNVVGMPTSERSLLLSWEESRTGVVQDYEGLSPADQDIQQSIVDMLYAARDLRSSSQDLGLVHLRSNFLPPTAKALDPLDQIVIASDRILRDTAAVVQLRSWLQSGGRLWIMVDRIDHSTAAAILGDAACYSVVDRVELNEFDMQRTDPFAVAEKIEAKKWSSERPAELVRVFAEADDIACTIDGWPAAFWLPVGHGEVLFTTLGANGWLDGAVPTEALGIVASRFFDPRTDPPRHTSKIESFLDEEIGYQIPGRVTVAGILGAHMLLVLVAGAWLASRKSLHQLATLIPVAAVLAGGALLAIGKQQTSSVPSTIAIGQIARLNSESSAAQVESVAAVYCSESRSLQIESSPSTSTRIPDVESSPEMKRVVWDDTGGSRWLFVTQPPGVVRHIESDSIVPMPQPWGFRGRFTSDGFRGRITGLDAGRCEDPVIVSLAAPPLAVQLQQSTAGQTLSTADDVLLPDQYIDDRLVSDVQQDRQNLLRQLMSAAAPLAGREPMLVAWTDPVNSGVEFDEGFVRRGSTLALIPIRYERLASGMDFLVPASFVRLETYRGTGGATSLYNAETGKWLDQQNKPSESSLRCVLPRVLLPCELKRATVLIKITAPSRTVELRGMINDQWVTIHRRQNPAGLLRLEIDDPDALQLDADGGWLLSIAVLATEEERRMAQQPPEVRKDFHSRDTWQIEYVHVNLEGTAL